MDTYQVVTLVRIRRDGLDTEIWNDSFRVKTETPLDEQALLNRLRFCVKRFLQTNDGLEAIEDTRHDFNWGDAIQTIPNDFWNKYGVHFIMLKDSAFQCCGGTAILVNQDEVLCDAAIAPDDKRCLCSTCIHRVTERNGEPVLDCTEAFTGVSEIADDGEIVLACDDYSGHIAADSVLNGQEI